MSHYDKNLDKNNANYVPLSPLSFLERTKDIYPKYNKPEHFVKLGRKKIEKLICNKVKNQQNIT